MIRNTPQGLKVRSICSDRFYEYLIVCGDENINSVFQLEVNGDGGQIQKIDKAKLNERIQLLQRDHPELFRSR